MYSRQINVSYEILVVKEQLFGISMGTRSAQSIANLDFGYREKQILLQENKNPLVHDFPLPVLLWECTE